MSKNQDRSNSSSTHRERSTSAEGAPLKTKGELEAEISQAVIRFEKEYLGRGPLETKTYLIEDMILVRLRNVLSIGEIKLVEAEDPSRGRDLVKALRRQLLEQGRPLLDAAVRGIVGVEIRSFHTDVSTRTGERIIVFTLESTPIVRS
ncbi:MAG: DUF2294 domain-containing protein [Planctomycetia bacterium]